MTPLSRRQFVSAAAAAATALLARPARLASASPATASPPPGPAGDYRKVTVSAGKLDRTGAVVSVRLDRPTTSVIVSDAAGNRVPAQVTPADRVLFAAGPMRSGESRTFDVASLPLAGSVPLGAPTPPAERLGVGADRDGSRSVLLTDAGRPVLTYRGEKVSAPAGFGPEYDRGGYIEPLLTPAGVRVTDDYPPTHKHHHGVWAPWTKTEFEGRKPDFWNMGQKSGTVEFVSVDRTWSGDVAAGFAARHRFVDLSAKPAGGEPKAAGAGAKAAGAPKVVLSETWEVRAYAAAVFAKADAGKLPPYHLFDWQSTQACATDQPLKLPKYQYGGLGVRGNRQWDGAAHSAFLTSEGKTRKDGNDSAARWVAMSGKVDGKSAYVAVLCHPGNFRSPQPVRLHPTEPFLCYAPQIQGDMAIEPGKPYTSKYRFVVGDGEPDKAELDRLWADYADPVKVEVKEG